MVGLFTTMWSFGLGSDLKKASVLLGIVVLGSVVMSWTMTGDAARRDPASAQVRSERDRDSEVRQVSSSLFPADPNFTGKDTQGLEAGELFLKMLVLVMVVLGLGIGGCYFSKKFGTKISRLSNKEVHVLETAHLGPRKVLHLVGIGQRRLLVASTNENITLLADVTEALIDSQIVSEQSGQTFADHLS